VLLNRLCVETGGMLRYKILRGLGRLMSDVPDLHLDEKVLDAVVEDHLAQAFPNLHWLAVLTAGAAEVPARRTVGHRLLLELIGQRQAFAVERLFRVLGLRAPGDDVALLYDSVHSDDAVTRAAGRELLEQLLPARWRGAVLALVDDAPEADRLASGAPFYKAAALDYDTLLVQLAAHPSEAVASLASYHAVELGILDAARARHPLDASANWFRAWEQAASDHVHEGATALAVAEPPAEELAWAAAPQHG
jgi:hypothetical protein